MFDYKHDYHLDVYLTPHSILSSILSCICCPWYSDENNPGHLNVWSRQEAGWLDPIVIQYSGIYNAQPAETSSDGFKITLADFGFYPEYLMIENRQQLGFDVDMVRRK